MKLMLIVEKIDVDDLKLYEQKKFKNVVSFRHENNKLLVQVKSNGSDLFYQFKNVKQIFIN